MDAFEFDQRFARYVSQVDSDAIRTGTELYESGAAKVIQALSKQIKGSVVQRREGVFNVSLLFSGDRGMSGSCDCPQVFNCAHNYALARACRDHLAGSVSSAPDRKGSAKAAGKPKSEERRELEKAWRTANQTNYTLYPRDLYGLVKRRSDFGVLQREPLRDLKRTLVTERPSDLQAFARILLSYFEYRKIEPREGLAVPGSPESDAQSQVTAIDFAFNEEAGKVWDRAPLQLSCRITLSDTRDAGWFQAKASWEIVGGGFSQSEIATLRAARGAVVRLGSRGWFRLDERLPEPVARTLSTLGLDPERGNAQRLHALQADELFEAVSLTAGDRERLQAQLRKMQEIGVPDAPGRLSQVLRPYQKDGYAFLVRMSLLGCGGILADDMGLGKTLQAIAWLVWLKRRTGKLKALVVCPKSVVDNWVREPAKFETGLVAKTLGKGLGSLGDVEVLVANYAQLRIQETFLSDQNWTAVILDEAQYIKSPDSQTAKVAHRLKADHRIALTGTPIENSLSDLWSVMRFAMPRLLGPLATFRRNYDARDPKSLLSLQRRLRPFLLRRLKTEVANELPERIEEDLYCELEEEQRAIYDNLLVDARATIGKGELQTNAFNILQILLRLRQVCCDPQLLGEKLASDSMSSERSAKIQAALDLIEPLVAEGHKVLVFSQFVQLLKIVETALHQTGIENLMLTGQTRNRTELIDRFQKPDTEPVFLLSLKAAGSGLTLTAASYVILMDPWWNPAVESQAIDRAHRIGQENQVVAYRILTKNTIEEKIRRLQLDKAELASALFGEGTTDRAIDIDAIRELLDSH